MLPGHCKDVAVKEVKFKLTAENITENIQNKYAYTRCEYYVLRNEGDTAVVAVSKEENTELLKKITSHKIISLPADTLYLKDERIDVINMPAMAEISKKCPGKVVVVEGKFGHVSFTEKDSYLELEVLDVVPPYPSKLSGLVEIALATGMIEYPISVRYEDININELAQNVDAQAVLFPCMASGLQSGKKDYYLDQIPDIKEECTLVGCDLSRRIYQSIYGKDITKQVEMCPHKLAPNDGKKRILKCCKIKNDYVLDANTVLVPWGATVKEVIDAINGLFLKEFSHDSSP